MLSSGRGVYTMKKYMFFCILVSVLFVCQGCNHKQYITSEMIEGNKAAYDGEVVQFTLPLQRPVGGCTITNAEGQTLGIDAHGLYGDLPLLSMDENRFFLSYDIPYSSSFVYATNNASLENHDSFQIYGEKFSCGASGSGIRKISVSYPNRIEIEGNREMDVRVIGSLLALPEVYADTCPGGKTPEIWIDSRAGSTSIVAEFTETGAIVSGLQGQGEIIVYTNFEIIMQESYDFMNATVEIDIVSQPGEILVTPIEG